MMNTGKTKVTTPSDREIMITREFNAPRALVYDAYTRPELIRRWLGVQPGWSMAVCEVDLRVGGTYRYQWRGPDGMSMGMRGVYWEIVPREKLVSSEKFDEAWYQGDAMGTVEFRENAGRTTITTTIRYDSQEIRDAVLKSPMEQGMAAAFNTLEELLASL
ncbi:MAG: SRPBCC family protein [Myxococcota bacterium]